MLKERKEFSEGATHRRNTQDVPGKVGKSRWTEDFRPWCSSGLELWEPVGLGLGSKGGLPYLI